MTTDDKRTDDSAPHANGLSESISRRRFASVMTAGAAGGALAATCGSSAAVGAPDGRHIFPSGAPTEINPQWFGAKLDGYRDDTEEVQAAVDEIKKRGAGVLVLNSFAKVKSIDVTMPDKRQGITIRGTGLGSGFIAGAKDTDILVIDTGPSNYQQFKLSDIEFNMNGLNATAIKYVRAAMYSTVENVLIRNPTTSRTTRALIDIGAESHSSRFRNVQILGTSERTCTGISNGSTASNGSNAVVFEGLNLLLLNNGIAMRSGSGCSGLVIRDCAFEVNNRAISFDGAGVLCALIQGCRFEDSAEFSIYLKGFNAAESRQFAITIANSYFTHLDEAKHYGISAERINGLRIVGNLFKSQDPPKAGKAVRLESDLTNIHFEGNVVYDLSNEIIGSGAYGLANDISVNQDA